MQKTLYSQRWNCEFLFRSPEIRNGNVGGPRNGLIFTLVFILSHKNENYLKRICVYFYLNYTQKPVETILHSLTANLSVIDRKAYIIKFNRIVITMPFRYCLFFYFYLFCFLFFLFFCFFFVIAIEMGKSANTIVLIEYINAYIFALIKLISNIITHAFSWRRLTFIRCHKFLSAHQLVLLLTSFFFIVHLLRQVKWKNRVKQ